MTEQSPEPLRPDSDEEPAAPMPRWIPVTIGTVLVLLAGFAIYTGMQYRDTTLVDMVKGRKAPARTSGGSAPQGEPGAGSSLVVADPSGAVVPAAGEPVKGGSRAVVTGGPGGIEAVIRMWARRGMMFTVEPDDAVIYVNEIPIGSARQFDTTEEIYDFATPGSYTVRIVAPGHGERKFIVTAGETAKDDIAHVKVKLPKS